VTSRPVPVAPRARRIPSITAQSMPLRCAEVFRFAANFGERRSAGGVGSGSGEFNQIVAAPSGPSISGFGAGFSFGSSTERSCVHCERASARLPPDLPPLRLADGVAGLDDESLEEPPLLTCVKPPSHVPAVESAASAESAGADGSAAGAAASSAGAEASVDSGAGAASSAAGAASDASVVVASIGVSSSIEAENLLPATAANDAPAKNTSVKTKVRASRRLRDLGSRASPSAGSGLPPKSQFSLRVNDRGIALSSFLIEPLAATRGADCGL
jgi:hypothetical protein